jgi:hypothetical protein
MNAPSMLEAEVKQAAELMLHGLERTDAIRGVTELLDKMGALPPYPDDETNEQANEAAYLKRAVIIDAMFARVCACLLKSGSLADAITHALPMPKIPSGQEPS